MAKDDFVTLRESLLAHNKSLILDNSTLTYDIEFNEFRIAKAVLSSA